MTLGLFQLELVVEDPGQTTFTQHWEGLALSPYGFFPPPALIMPFLRDKGKMKEKNHMERTLTEKTGHVN